MHYMEYHKKTRMKRIMVAVALAALTMGARGQDVLGTMLEQLAALKGYIATAERGYTIAEHGLHTIGEIRRGEFGLHSVFFGSLVRVNASVRDMPVVAETMQSAEQMLRVRSAAMARWRSSGLLSAGELDYASRVLGRMESKGREDIQALVELLKDDALKMEDGERYRQIKVIDQTIREQGRDGMSFIRGVDLLILGRQKELRTLKFLYDLHAY